MLQLIAPVQYGATKVGTYITPRQPDVEVLAVALDDVPHNAEEFDKKKGGRDWIICKFLIVAVGSAGFGKVPYKQKHKGKKGSADDEECKSLYENIEASMVKLYAYEKGDTNKDKGPRVDDCFGVLCPGLCLTFFLREEMFQASKIIADRVIGKTQFVCLQVGSSNVGLDSSKGAAGGWLIKLKKIKSIAPPDDVMQALTKMPATEEAYDLLMSQHRNTHTSMKGVLSDKVEVKYSAVSSMGRDVFAVYENNSFVICNSGIINKEGFTDEIVVHKDLVLACFDTLCVDTALRVLNIALCVDAVRLLLQTAPEVSIALNEDEVPPPNTALHVLCDYNKLLLFDALKDDAIGTWVQDKLRSFSQAPAQDMADSTVIGNMQLEIARPHDIPFCTLTYTSTDNVYKDHAGIVNHIYIRVHEFVDFNSEPASLTESAPKFLAHSKSGAFNRVEILLRPPNTAGPMKPVASLQMRRGAMSTLGSKRKRPNISTDFDEN
jgi:hypothetical protein